MLRKCKLILRCFFFITTKVYPYINKWLFMQLKRVAQKISLSFFKRQWKVIFADKKPVQNIKKVRLYVIKCRNASGLGRKKLGLNNKRFKADEGADIIANCGTAFVSQWSNKIGEIKRTIIKQIAERSIHVCYNIVPRSRIYIHVCMMTKCSSTRIC